MSARDRALFLAIFADGALLLPSREVPDSALVGFGCGFASRVA